MLGTDIPTWFGILSGALVVSSALSAGLFLTFSDFLMRSFQLSEDRAGVEVMQVLNREIFRSLTIVLLFGNIPVSAFLAVYAYVEGFYPLAHFLGAGAVSYFFGVLIVSYVVNVPMNETLDPMDRASEKTTAYWRESYVARWVHWNWIRALAAITTSVCFLVGLT